MTTPRRMWVAVTTATILPLLMLSATSGAAVAPGAPQLPQSGAAARAEIWLASQVTAKGYVTTPDASTPDLSSTAQYSLALAASDVDLPAALRALDYMKENVNAFVATDGSDGPGELALLILDAEALGVSPTDFGGSNLVSRLLATQETSGSDAGLFGTATQVVDYSAGGYQQGLALAALASAGVRGTPQVDSGVSWLLNEQCPDGGWTTPDNARNPCNGNPASYGGPDTNSTSLAVQGLVAQGALTTSARAKALSFLGDGQDADAGWSDIPNSSSAPGSSDPDSTALVIQALIALGSRPTASQYDRGAANPISALLSFQLPNGSLYYPGSRTPSPIATYQAIPALLGITLPFGSVRTGYWEVASDGGVFSFGDASFYGSMGNKTLNAPVVGITSTPDGRGYWEVASDGGVFSFGDASFYGSMGNKTLNAPVVGITSTPDGRGYWEVASDGGVFSFGDASFYGSMGNKTLNAPVVSIASTPDGRGYWEVASDGGVFSFGDASFYGSMGNKVLDKPVVGITSTPDGRGYWEVASDGGVFSFGDAPFYGSMGNKVLDKPVVGIASTPDGRGYWEVASDGGVFSFGDASFYGSMGNKTVNGSVVGIVADNTRVSS